MWEKELQAKYGNKYIISWALKPVSFLSAMSVEKRIDDALLTPDPKDRNDQDINNLLDSPAIQSNEAVSYFLLLIMYLLGPYLPRLKLPRTDLEERLVLDSQAS